MSLYTTVLTMNEYPDSLPEDEGIIGDEGTSNLGHPGFLPLPKTMGSKAIEGQYPWHLRCHLDRTAQMGRDVLDEVGGIEKKCI